MSNAIEIATPVGLLVAYCFFLFFIAIAYTLYYCLNNSDCYFVGGGMIAALVRTCSPTDFDMVTP
jgi:hypothetical protein